MWYAVKTDVQDQVAARTPIERTNATAQHKWGKKIQHMWQSPGQWELKQTVQVWSHSIPLATLKVMVGLAPFEYFVGGLNIRSKFLGSEIREIGIRNRPLRRHKDDINEPSSVEHQKISRGRSRWFSSCPFQIKLPKMSTVLRRWAYSKESERKRKKCGTSTTLNIYRLSIYFKVPTKYWK